MEAERRAAANTRKRKPLADRTNTNTITTRSSPSLRKLPPPHPTITNSASTAVAEPQIIKTRNKENKKQKLIVGSSSVETRSKRRRKLPDTTFTADDSSNANKENTVPDDVNRDNVQDVSASSPTTPALRQPLSPLVEPLTVYARRQSSNRKGKEKVTTDAFTCPPVERKREETKVSKCLTELPKKRRTKEQRISKDYFEQQRAYFAEIDKCELPEEEVSENELSDY